MSLPNFESVFSFENRNWLFFEVKVDADVDTGEERSQYLPRNVDTGRDQFIPV